MGQRGQGRAAVPTGWGVPWASADRGEPLSLRVGEFHGPARTGASRCPYGLGSSMGRCEQGRAVVSTGEMVMGNDCNAR